ncbi:MAG TPA: GNAT family N-acetyltransferase [Acidimicrobiales bacterium]|nr:GNAT family N-acetyltransferase [Acidimicrobiales bacterium]
MSDHIRSYAPGDEQAVVEQALAAWAPVFASMEAVLGRSMSVLLHGEDWRPYQEAAVRRTLGSQGMRTWVAEAGGGVVGFVSANVADPDRGLGEVVMLAVEPGHQGRGRGTALTETATAWLAEQGMRVAMIETGGDPGHAPARRVYEKAEYRPMPVARYFRALEDGPPHL